MQQLFKDFLMDMVRQLFGWSKPRQGRLMLTRRAFIRMRQNQLDAATIRDVFRHGERQGEKITRQYMNYSVGLYFIYDAADGTYVITTCWKGVKRTWRSL